MVLCEVMISWERDIVIPGDPRYTSDSQLYEPL